MAVLVRVERQLEGQTPGGRGKLWHFSEGEVKFSNPEKVLT